MDLQQKGFGLVEVVICAALLVLIIVGIQTVTQSALETSKRNLRETKATFILTEGTEVMRALRDNAWSNISTLGTTSVYYLSFASSTNTWTSTTTETFIDDLYTRKVTISDVKRDASDNIASSGTYDSGTKKVHVEVLWPEGNGTTTRTLDIYLTNI